MIFNNAFEMQKYGVCKVGQMSNYSQLVSALICKRMQLLVLTYPTKKLVSLASPF